MSFIPTSMRPFASGGWGGRANFRGALTVMESVPVGMTDKYPANMVDFSRGQIGGLILRRRTGYSNLVFTGTVRLRSDNSAVSGCTVNLIQGNIIKDSTTTDGSGNYTFLNPGSGPFQVDVYKVGSPDLFGTTRNDLQPSVV